MKKLLLSLIFLLTPFAAWADLPTENHWTVGLGVGMSFPELGTSHVSPGAGWPDDAHINTDVGTAGLLSVYGGYTIENQNTWFPAYNIGINYLYVASTDVTGHVQQFSLPEFENYQYQYEVQTQALFATLKIDLYRYKIVSPFVSAGIGTAWNELRDYDELALPDITGRINPDFPDNTSTHFAFLLGAGLDFVLAKALDLSLEYNYGDFGQVESEVSTVYIDETLDSALTANMILLSVRYALQ